MIIQGTNKPIRIRIKKNENATEISAVGSKVSAELFAVTGISTVKKLKHWDKSDMVITDVVDGTITYTVFELPQFEAETMLYTAGKCKLELKFLDTHGYIEFLQIIEDCIVQWNDKTVMGE